MVYSCPAPATSSPVKLQMPICCSCYWQGSISFPTVCLLISGVEQPVSRSTHARYFWFFQCIIISTIGRVPQMGVFGCFLEFPCSCCAFVLFSDMPLINTETLGCGGPWPPKNPPRFLSLEPRLVVPHFGRLLLSLPPLLALFPRVFV